MSTSTPPSSADKRRRMDEGDDEDSHTVTTLTSVGPLASVKPSQGGSSSSVNVVDDSESEDDDNKINRGTVLRKFTADVERKPTTKGKANVFIKCGVAACKRTFWGWAPFQRHLEEKHLDEKDVKETLSKLEVTKPQRSGSGASSTTSARTQTTITSFARIPITSEGDVRNGVARLLIEKDLSLDFVESEAFRNCLNLAVTFARTTSAREITLPRRDAFANNHIFGPQGLVEEMTGRAVNESMASVEQYGATLVHDGRTNVNGICLEAYQLEFGKGVIFLSSRDPGTSSKDASWYVRQYESFLVTASPIRSLQETSSSSSSSSSSQPATEDLAGPLLTKLVAQSTVAVATDGGSACSKAALQAQQIYGVIAVRCSLHNLNRVCVHVIDVKKVPFLRETWRKFTQVFGVFNWTMLSRFLANTKNGKVLLRAPDTRLIYIPLVAARMLAMIPNCLEVAGKVEVQQYMAKQSVDNRARFDEAVMLLKDALFVVGLTVLATCLTPLVLLAKELDRGVCNMPLVKWGWVNLAGQFGGSLDRVTGRA